MIECRDIRCLTDAGDVLFAGLDLVAGDAPLTAVAGANGSGKTALGLLMTGARLPDTGSITVDGGPAVLPPGAPRQAGLVFQNPDDQFTAVTVERELAFGLENLNTPRDRMRNLVEETLERYRLAPFRRLQPHALSGGEKRRLALASVLITAPAYVVLDEPYAMMGDADADELRGFVHECARQGTRFILLTKDPVDIERADAAYLLADGRAMGITGGSPLPQALTYPGALPGPEGGSGETLIEAESISFGYGGGRMLFNGVSLSVRAGRRTFITGPAGTGKTSLLSLLAGQARPRSGSVRWRGTDIRSRAGARALHTGCAFGFQFPEEQFFAPTAGEELRYTAHERGIGVDILEARICRWGKLLGWDMTYLDGCTPWSLDYGRRRLLAVLSLLAHGPELVLLDEPFAGLDGNGVRGLQAVLAGAEAEGVTFAFAGHAARHPFLQASVTVRPGG